MGGETIAAILEAAPWTKEGKLLLLQPMTSFPDLRLWLQKNGYNIENETITKEGRRLYTCLTVRAGQMEELTPAELWVGRQSSDPLRREFLAMMGNKIERALNGHLSASDPNRAEISSLQDVLCGIRKMEGELGV
jgi:tRNA (adenine22-N1)-methyltransferase